MRKVTDFIVKYHKLIIIFFLILTVVSFFLSSKVNINYSLTSYLPDSSNTKIGLNKMIDSFGTTGSSMSMIIKDLSNEDKENIYNDLKDYGTLTVEDNIEYKDNTYTLYTVTILEDSDTENAVNIYNHIMDTYSYLNPEYSGDIFTRNEPVLPTYVFILAIIAAMIILLILSDSYLEPFIILFVIGLSVIINKGTNIIFPSISSITDGVCAILQMALSMDYSFMLINRFENEKKKVSNNIDAMKNALYDSIIAIFGSSLTTIFGLLALIFMTFKIGMDLGLILAKGVLFSLINIFFVLPGLLLIFDKAINKTRKKKTLNFNLSFLGDFSYKIRKYVPVLFIVFFIFVFTAKDNLGYVYTAEYSRIFREIPSNNNIILLYNNKDEEDVDNYLDTLDEHYTVNSYGNTLNKKLKYNEVNDFINNLASTNLNISDNTLRMIYYYYYNKEDNSSITLSNLVDTAKDYTNVGILSNLTNKKYINKDLSLTELSNALGIDSGTIKKALILYNSKDIASSLTIRTIVNYLNYNKEYLSNDNITLLNTLNNVLDNYNIPYNYTDMSNLLNIDSDTLYKLYTYYLSFNNIDNKLTINELVTYLNNNKDLLDDNMKDYLTLITNVSNKKYITSNESIDNISNLYSISEDDTKKVILLNSFNNVISADNLNKIISILEDNNIISTYELDDIFNYDISSYLDLDNTKNYTIEDLKEYLNNLDITKEDIDNKIIDIKNFINVLDKYLNDDMDDITISPYDFIKTVSDNKLVTYFTDTDTYNKVVLLKNIMDDVINDNKLSYEDIANLLNINENTSKLLYASYLVNNDNITLTLKDLVTFIINNKDDDNFKGIDLTNIYLVNNLINDDINNILYDANTFANRYNISYDDISLIYSMYEIDNGKDIKVSITNLVNYLLESNNSFIDNNTKNKLNLLNKVLYSVNNDIKYNINEVYDLLNSYTNISLDKIKLLFIAYNSSLHSEYELTIEQLVNFVDTDIINNSLFSDYITSDIKDNISYAKDKLSYAKSLLVSDTYSRALITTTYGKEDSNLYSDFDNLYNVLSNDEVYVVGNSGLAYEMNKSFNNELLLITILTILFVFIIVAISFKSKFIAFVLVAVIQAAVYATMALLSYTVGYIYFIVILVVQSILMGATIDYGILFTSYYLEFRKNNDVLNSLRLSYKNSFKTILTSSLILIIVTFIVGRLINSSTSDICNIISLGALISTLLVLFVLPGLIAGIDNILYERKAKKNLKA